jgi:hypothetical protein
LHVVIKISAQNAGIRKIMHKVPDNEETSLDTTLAKISKQYIVIPLLLQGFDHHTTDNWTLHVNDDIDYSKTIHCPNTTECQHIIGNICIIAEKHDGKE